MRAYHKQIVDNVISYIAKKYQESYGEPINQMKMYKILALFDFASVKKFGRPCTEFTYLALKKGPVPNELYNGDESIYERFTTKRFDVNGNTYKYYISTVEPNLDYFSQKEIALLDEIIDYFIKNNLSSNEASALTHEKISAWKKAWKKRQNSIMNYADEFDRLYEKNENELSPEEEHFLIYNGFSYE